MNAFPEVCEAQGLIWLGNIDQVMRDAFAFMDPRLGGTDVHAPVEGAGIHGNDLGVEGLADLQ